MTKSLKTLLAQIVGRLGGAYTTVNAQNGIDGFLRLFKDNSTNTVRGYGYFRRSTNIDMATVIFTIPSGWRPSANWWVPVFMYTAESKCIAYHSTIKTNGEYTQDAGSVMREGFTSFEYTL